MKQELSLFCHSIETNDSRRLILFILISEKYSFEFIITEEGCFNISKYLHKIFVVYQILNEYKVSSYCAIIYVGREGPIEIKVLLWKIRFAIQIKVYCRQ